MLAHLANDLQFDLLMTQEHSLISSPGLHQLDLWGDPGLSTSQLLML